jgi:hypothetical protein
MNALVLSLLVPVLSLAYDANYDTSQSLRYIDFSGAAYCTDPIFGQDQITNWNCQACKAHPNVVAQCFHSDKPDGNGYVAYDPDVNEIIVAFSGTDPLSIRNWIDDIDFVKTDYPYCDGCQVHQGFYKTFMSVQEQVMNLTTSFMTQYPSAALTVTGHSLGAALAGHCVAEFVHQGLSVTSAYVYGMPRVGDEAFEQWFISVVPGLFRVVHHKDPVPHLPTESMGFHHMPYEVFYTHEYDEYKVCSIDGEDENCSDQYKVDLNVGMLTIALNNFVLFESF